MNGKGGMNNKEFEWTIAMFPSSMTLRTHQGSVSCSRSTKAVVAIGGTSSTSVGSGLFISTPACPTLPLYSRRWTSITVCSRVLFGGTYCKDQGISNTGG
jgi:hypothetical protein